MTTDRPSTHAPNEGPGGCVPWENYERLRLINDQNAQRASDANVRLQNRVLELKREVMDREAEINHWRRMRDGALEAWGDAEQDLDALRTAVREAVDDCMDGETAHSLLTGLALLLPNPGASDEDQRKPPCLYPLPDGRRCCECDACQVGLRP